VDRSLVVAGVIATALISIGVASWPRQSSPPPVRIVAAANTETITVHVSGAVARPGLVTLPQGARVADAIAAGGGALPEGIVGHLNLAAPVSEGSRIVVPGPGSGEGADASSDGVRINAASASELEHLPGVGPVLAGRILAFRQDHGPFEEVEDLLDVPGIGESKLAAMRDSVILP
jgi:competence protein ComEA